MHNLTDLTTFKDWMIYTILQLPFNQASNFKQKKQTNKRNNSNNNTNKKPSNY